MASCTVRRVVGNHWVNTSPILRERTNLPAVKLLGMFLPHDVETMRNGGVLKERIKRLVQVLQTKISFIGNLLKFRARSLDLLLLYVPFYFPLQLYGVLFVS